MKDFMIGDWHVVPRRNLLTKNGAEIRIAPKVMDLLCRLAQDAGQVVTREELLDDVWKSHIVEDVSLTNAISALRTAFGDDRRAPKIIQTIPKRGYRLVLPVAAIESLDAESQPSPPRPGSRSILQLAAGIGLLLAASIVLFLDSGRDLAAVSPSLGAREERQVRPLTSEPGAELWPALSPSGSRLAYVREGDLYLQDLESGETRRLTASETTEMHPAWSPSGDWIAYIARGAGTCRIDALAISDRRTVSIGTCGAQSFPSLDWHRSGQWVVFNHSEASYRQQRIALRSIEGGALRLLRLPSISDGIRDFRYPRFSPDGSRLAVVAHGERGAELLIGPFDAVWGEVDARPGSLQRIGPLPARITGLDWTSDGATLIFTASTDAGVALWQIPAEGGRPIWIPTPGASPAMPQGTERGIVFADMKVDRDLYRMTLRDGAAQTQPIARSTGADYAGVFSPDGSTIAFVSTRTGKSTLWIADADGGNAHRLGPLADVAGAPAWSPDGRRLLVAAREGDRHDLYLVDRDSGEARPLTRTGRREIAGGWSADGSAVYFSTIEDGSARAFRMILDSRETVPVAAVDALGLRESPDGRHIYFTRLGAVGIWRLDRQTGRTETVLPASRDMRWIGWDVGRRGVYMLADGTEGPELRFRPHEGDETRRLAGMPDLSRLGETRLSVSEMDDGPVVLYARAGSMEADIRIVEGAVARDR